MRMSDSVLFQLSAYPKSSAPCIMRAVGDLSAREYLETMVHASEPIEPMLNVNNFGWTSSGWNMGCMIQNTTEPWWDHSMDLKVDGCALFQNVFESCCTRAYNERPSIELHHKYDYIRYYKPLGRPNLPDSR